MNPQLSMQLSLPIHLRDDETFASFFAAENKQLLADLRQCASGLGEQFVYLWGTNGAGCSHLLNACCHLADEFHLSSALIPLADHKQMTIDILDGMHELDLICIDDIQSIAGNSQWEQAVFNLFNRLRDRDGCLVVGANEPPKSLSLELPDLASRMSWGVSYQILPLNDDEKLQALKLRAKRRGLKLPEDVGRFMLNRLDRNMRTLFRTLEQLDQASMAAQRKLTIPFVKQVLDL